jgi:plasmid maintenance system antidote protein VapI
MKPESIHIGMLIEQKVREAGLTNAEFARRICVARSTVNSIFGKEHINAPLLNRISDVLDYDFFAHYTAAFYQRKERRNGRTNLA